jgi:hypothetical protein
VTYNIEGNPSILLTPILALLPHVLFDGQELSRKIVGKESIWMKTPTWHRTQLNIAPLELKPVGLKASRALNKAIAKIANIHFLLYFQPVLGIAYPIAVDPRPTPRPA